MVVQFTFVHLICDYFFFFKCCGCVEMGNENALNHRNEVLLAGLLILLSTNANITCHRHPSIYLCSCTLILPTVKLLLGRRAVDP